MSSRSEILSVALPKGRLGDKVYDIFERAGFGCPDILDPGRKLIFESPEHGVRYFFVKPSDVAIYVERGAADIGVAGKDILLEYAPDVYELLDLGRGQVPHVRMRQAGFHRRRRRLLAGRHKIFQDHPEILRLPGPKCGPHPPERFH